MAYLGLGYNQARAITFYEYNARITGIAELQEREWNKVRVLASLLLQPHTKRGRTIRPKDLIPLPSDSALPEAKRMNRAEIAKDVEMKLKAYRMN